MKVKYEKEFFTKIVSESINYTDVCRKLNISCGKGNRDTVKKYILNYDIDISHFKIPLPHQTKKYSLNEVLVEYSPYKHTSDLKNRLYKEGLKKRCCELCGQGEEWTGKKMSLILDHINGVNDDNRIENLRIVCPNCNATLDTHGGRNIKRIKSSKKETIKKNNKLEKEENNGKTLNQINSSIRQRKVERPDINILLEEINCLGYSATGRKYGVSDNTIRKWVK
jgi:hypothetical protein